MEKGQFCFLSEKYYDDFLDSNLMRNKEMIGGKAHNRPCFFAFPDDKNNNILWLVPISSKIDKYSNIYNKKIEKYGRCNTIRFGEVVGNKSAFLIQNMCPVTQKYIENIYKDKNGIVIEIDKRIVTDVIKNAKEVLEKVNHGNRNLVFPDIHKIYSILNKQLQKEHPDKRHTLDELIKAVKEKQEANRVEDSVIRNKEKSKEFVPER